MNNDDSTGCGCYIFALILGFIIYILVGGDEDKFNLAIISIIVLAILILILRSLSKTKKVEKYNKKYPDLNITKKDLKRHIKLNRKDKIIYLIDDIGINKDLLKIPFEKIDRFDWTNNVDQNLITIFTNLDSPSLSIIKLHYSDLTYFEEAKKMLYYVITHNEENSDKKEDEEVTNNENNSDNNKEEKPSNTEEELRKLIEEQNKRIEELEKNQKNSNDSDEE